MARSISGRARLYDAFGLPIRGLEHDARSLPDLIRDALRFSGNTML
jgi:hypothetical protein